jgi:TPR repeat protein
LHPHLLMPSWRCAATQRVLIDFPDNFTSPTFAKHTIVTLDRSVFRSSAAADQPRLSAALGAYYRGEWAKAVDALKPAASTDANVQFVTALALLIPNTTDQVRDALTLLRTASAAGHRQASVVLGRMLFIGGPGLPKDEQQGRKLIEDGALAGDPYAMRLAGVGYLSREFGTYDPAKAVELMRKAADAGEPIAMTQFAEFLYSGRGGLARDEAKALDYLRRGADAGHTFAQFKLGWWMSERYLNRETEDLSEGIKWYESAYQKGYWFDPLVNLAVVRRFARATPWFDTPRSYALLQLCAPYAHARCHYWLGAAYQAGAGTSQDLVKAYAHYTVARQLGSPEAPTYIQQLDAILLPAAKASGTQLAGTLSASLKAVPSGINLQMAEADAAGPSPWSPQAAPAIQPAQGAESPSRPSAATADWATCKGDDKDAAIAACARLIASGIAGTDLGLAHYLKAWGHYNKQQYTQAIAEYDKAIQLGATPSHAHNDRGLAYLALGNLDAALRDFNEAVGIDSTNAFGFENRAYVQLRRNRFDEVIADATSAIRLNPKRARNYWIRAGAYGEKGQWTESVADATTCIGLDPKFSDCLDRRGYAYYKLERATLRLPILTSPCVWRPGRHGRW